MNLSSPFDPEEVPSEWWLERLRIHRDRLLAASDWTQVADAPVDQQAWAVYRQQLRDFPATWTPGPVAAFPLAPGEQPAPTVEEVEAPAYVPDTRTFGDANPDVNPDGL
jgi:hypothetical protein